MEHKLNFHQHILTITSRASKQLGFIFREWKFFSTLQPIILLYNGLVRTILGQDCSGIFYCPGYRSYRNRNRFLLPKANYNYPKNSPVYKICNLSNDRSASFNFWFIYVYTSHYLVIIRSLSVEELCKHCQRFNFFFI